MYVLHHNSVLHHKSVLHCAVVIESMSAYNLNKQGQLINRPNICPHCRVQQAPQARNNVQQGYRTQKRARVQQCTLAAKQEATSSAEDTITDSRAEARRRRREDRQSVEPLVDDNSPVEIDPVSQLT